MEIKNEREGQRNRNKINEVRADSSWAMKMIFLIVITMLPRTISGIVYPDAFWHKSEESERIRIDENVVGNRSLIITETMERYERNLLLSRSTSCISTFLQNRSISFRYSTSVLPSIFGHVGRRVPVEMDSLAHTLQAELATYTVNDAYVENPMENFTSSVIVVVIENSLDIESVNCSCYLKKCTYECEFVVIMTRIFENETDFLYEADTLQRSMWLESVSRLVILGSTPETVLLAGSRSFKPEELCQPSAPVLLGSCRTSSSSTVKKNSTWRFDMGKIVDRDLPMNSCTLVVGYYNNSPYSFTTNETTDDKILGLEGLMIEEVLYNMNIRLLREMLSPFSGNESHKDDLRMTTDQIDDYNGRVDLLMGGLLWNPSETTDYTIAYDMVPLVWMIPIKPNVSLRGLVAPFSTLVWIAILSVILLGVLVKFFLIKDISFLNILALFLGVSVFRQPELPSSRMLFLCWSFFGFFVSQYYLASLADQLVNASNLQIETMKELLSSGLELGGILRYAALFTEIDEDDNNDEEDFIIRGISERFHVFPYENYMLQLSDLLNGKNQSTAVVAKLNVSNSLLNFPKQYVHILNENLGSYPLAMATWKGFPCLKKINMKMRQLMEAGIIEYWARLVTLNGAYYHSMDDTQSSTDVNLESVAPGFLLLVIGYLAGFCVLIIEIIAYPSKWLA